MYTQTHTHNVYYYNISQVFEVMGILVQALLLLLMMMVHISSMTNTGNHFIRYFSTFSFQWLKYLSSFNIASPVT